MVVVVVVVELKCYENGHYSLFIIIITLIFESRGIIMSKLTINQQIAVKFLIDSRDFLLRYRILCERSLKSHAGMRYKLLTELLFAAECAIKGMIFSESTNDENATYKQILRHDLNKLLNQVSSKERDVCSKYIDSKLRDIPIDIRYLTEGDKNFGTDGVLGEEYYDMAANFDWQKSVYKNLCKLEEYINSKIPNKDFELIDLNKVDTDEMLKETYRIAKLGKPKKVSKKKQ